MGEKNTGGPAYPSQELSAGGLPTRMLYEGMTLRDYFAGEALAGMWLNIVWVAADVYNAPRDDQINLAARQAYKIADAMIKEREL
jgi:hypothetical protein